MKTFLLTLGLATMVCGGVALAPQKVQAQTRTEVKIRLTGLAIAGVLPQGSSRYRTREANRRDFNVEVNRVNLATGTVLTVNLNGAPIGTIRLSLGAGKFERNTQDGQTVPFIKTGDKISVLTASGAVILSGSY